MSKNWKHTNNGFQTPENYFDTLEQEVFAKIKMQKIDPNKSSGYKVPDNYFNDWDTRIASIKSESKNTPVFKLYKNTTVISIAAIAACLAIVFFIINPNQKTINFEDVTSTSLEEYLMTDGIEEYLSQEEVLYLEENTSFLDSQTLSEDAVLYNIDAYYLGNALDEE